MNFLCVDIGTTRSKAQVFDSDGEILFYQSAECPLKEVAGEKYADILFIRDTDFFRRVFLIRRIFCLFGRKR